MAARTNIAPVRILPEAIANKIAAGEVVERPASVVKELVENALDAQATRVSVRLVAAGRRTIEVLDNGHGMSENDALMAIERHATSKIRKAEDLDNISTLGFRGEALASIAAVSRFELQTRREKDESATRIRIEGGVLRDVSQVAGPVGTRVTVNRLYFNTPVRAKFLKGITTELSQCIDIVQRHALAAKGVGFQLDHNEKQLIDVQEGASLRERIALVWGLNYVNDMVEIADERSGIRVSGFIGTPKLSRSSRGNQYFFVNGRPALNRAMQYAFEDGYRALLTVGRRPVCVLLLEMSARDVDVNIHPTKREVRFRDERQVRAVVGDVVRERLAGLLAAVPRTMPAPLSSQTPSVDDEPKRTERFVESDENAAADASLVRPPAGDSQESSTSEDDAEVRPASVPPPAEPILDVHAPGIQTEFGGKRTRASGDSDAGQVPVKVEPEAVFHAIHQMNDAPLQVFDTYLLVPDEDRILIIDQHALHERLTFDSLIEDLRDDSYQAQRLVVPLVFDVPPSHVKMLESNLELFSRLGIEIEPFGGNTFQITALCHVYAESKISDAIFRILDTLAQGDLFSREDFMTDMLRLTMQACRSSIKAGDPLSPQERRSLLDGFRRLRPPYTCPHGRPIITELTQYQMEKSFRRRQ